MQVSDKNIEAVKLLADLVRADLLLAAAPLTIVLAQLGFLLELDCVILKLFGTVAVISLFCGLTLSWFYWSALSAWRAKMIFEMSGGSERQGLRLVEVIERGGKVSFDEDYVLAIRRLTYPATYYAILLGYLMAGALIVGLVWS